jgi:4-hydroxybenzoate polyprenyltransferase
MPVDEAPRQSLLRPYLELVRLPNLFTAAADVMMGFLFVQVVPAPGTAEDWVIGRGTALVLAILTASSVLLYAGGVVLNDLLDGEIDRVERPERPIPSGRVSRRAARWIAWEALLIGWFLPWTIAVGKGDFRIGLVASLLVACIVLYSAVLKPTPLGPLGMGGCRMLNVLLGMSVLAGPFQRQHWLVAGAIGIYIAGLTWLSRHEATRSRRLQLAEATLVMAAGVAMLGWLPNWAPKEDLVYLLREAPERWYILMGVLGATICWRCLWAVIEPLPHRVQMAVTHGIMSLVVLDAAVCFAARGISWAIVILLLLLPAVLFGTWIRST